MDHLSHNQKLALHNSASRSPNLSRSTQLSQVNSHPTNSPSGRDSPAHPQWETLSSASNPPKPQPKKPRPKRSPDKSPGQLLLPASRVEAILNADPDNGTLSKEAVFCLTYATEQFIKSLTHHAHTRASLEGRVLTQYKDLADTAHYFDEFSFLKDMIPRPVKLGDALAARVSKLANQEATNDADMEVEHTSAFSGFVNESVASTSSVSKDKKTKGKKRAVDARPIGTIVNYGGLDGKDRTAKKRRRGSNDSNSDPNGPRIPEIKYVQSGERQPSSNPTTNANTTSTSDGVHIIRIRPRQIPAGQAHKQLLAEKAKNSSSNDSNGFYDPAIKSEEAGLEQDVEMSVEEVDSIEPVTDRDDTMADAPSNNSDKNHVERHLPVNGHDTGPGWTTIRIKRPLQGDGEHTGRRRKALNGHAIANGKAHIVGNGVVFAPVGASDAPLWTRLPLPPPPSANLTSGARGSAASVEAHLADVNRDRDRITPPPPPPPPHSPRPSMEKPTNTHRHRSPSLPLPASPHHLARSPPIPHALPPIPQHPHSPHAQMYAAAAAAAGAGAGADDHLNFRNALSPSANPGRTIYSQQR